MGAGGAPTDNAGSPRGGNARQLPIPSEGTHTPAPLVGKAGI